MSKEIETAVASALETMNVPYKAVYVGECASPFGDNAKKRMMDHYQVTFGSFTTDFYQGLGNRKPTQPMPTPPYRRDTLAYEAWEKTKKPVPPPTAAGVLYCLLSDAEAVDMSFMDWAGELGYDTDSIKARNTYDRCCEIGHALRKVFTAAQRAELRNLLQDY